MSQEKTLVVVTSHGAFPKCHEHHAALWKANGAEILTFFPEKSPDGKPGAFEVTNAVSYGTAGPLEPLSSERFLWLLKHLWDKTRNSHYLLFSHKSVCLEPTLPEKLYQNDALWGAFPKPADESLQEVRAPYFPLFFSRNILKKMLELAAPKPTVPQKPADKPAADGEITLPSVTWDNLVVDLIAKELPYATFGPRAFARHVILPKDELDAQRAIEGGAIFIHGVQSHENNRQVKGMHYVYNYLKMGGELKGKKVDFALTYAPSATAQSNNAPTLPASNVRPAFTQNPVPTL